MAFTNPTGFWQFSGSFVVLLSENAATDFLSKDPRMSLANKTLTVKSGWISGGVGGIDFNVNGKGFGWVHNNIIEIRDGFNRLLWHQNPASVQ